MNYCVRFIDSVFSSFVDRTNHVFKLFPHALQHVRVLKHIQVPIAFKQPTSRDVYSIDYEYICINCHSFFQYL